MLAEAFPSAPTPRPIFDRLVGELLDGIEAAGAIDGVLLELHGAMLAEGIDDAEGHILDAVRRLVGPDMPVVGQLDIHSNVSHAMIETADVLIGRETYPEVDMAPRGPRVRRRAGAHGARRRAADHGLAPTAPSLGA